MGRGLKPVVAQGSGEPVFSVPLLARCDCPPCLSRRVTLAQLKLWRGLLQPQYVGAAAVCQRLTYSVLFSVLWARRRVEATHAKCQPMRLVDLSLNERFNISVLKMNLWVLKDRMGRHLPFGPLRLGNDKDQCALSPSFPLSLSSSLLLLLFQILCNCNIHSRCRETVKSCILCGLYYNENHQYVKRCLHVTSPPSETMTDFLIRIIVNNRNAWLWKHPLMSISPSQCVACQDMIPTPRFFASPQHSRRLGIGAPMSLQRDHLVSNYQRSLGKENPLKTKHIRYYCHCGLGNSGICHSRHCLCCTLRLWPQGPN